LAAKFSRLRAGLTDGHELLNAEGATAPGDRF
jgi:hypothetical protein